MLCLVTLAVALRRGSPWLLRVAAASFSLASFLGVLRFSGLYPDPLFHQAFSALSGTAGFPAMALACLRPQWKVSQDGRRALALVALLGLIGIIIVLVFTLRVYLVAVTLGALLAALAGACRQRRWLELVSVLVMIGGALVFAAKQPLVPGLEPADILHLALALGWLGISQRFIANRQAVNDLSPS